MVGMHSGICEDIAGNSTNISLGCPVLTITTHDAAGGQLYHEAHRLSIECLRERGMVEEVTTAMERRRQAHGRA